MNHLQTHLSKIQSAISLLDSFVSNYGSKIPDGVGCIGLGWGSGHDPSFCLHMTHMSDQNRLRGLQMMGDVFGRDGWVSTPRRNDACFDWKKTVDGVAVEIYGAEVMPQMVPMPVHPSKFPLQLEDVQ